MACRRSSASPTRQRARKTSSSTACTSSSSERARQSVSDANIALVPAGALDAHAGTEQPACTSAACTHRDQCAAEAPAEQRVCGAPARTASLHCVVSWRSPHLHPRPTQEERQAVRRPPMPGRAHRPRRRVRVPDLRPGRRARGGGARRLRRAGPAAQGTHRHHRRQLPRVDDGAAGKPSNASRCGMGLAGAHGDLCFRE